MGELVEVQARAIAALAELAGALTGRLLDDRETIGELAARLTTLDAEVTELRDEQHELAVRATARLDELNHELTSLMRSSRLQSERTA